MRDLVQGGLGAAAGQALGRAGVQAVLEHVQVEAAQVFRAEQLQLGHHGVEFIDLVVGQQLGLELGGAGQGPAVDLQQLFGGNRVLRSIEVADVGQQEAQRVADAEIGRASCRERV